MAQKHHEDSALVFESLQAPFGVQVKGLSLLAEELPSATLQRALDQHRLLLFRDTLLEDERQVALMQCFGEPLQENPHRRERYSFVSNTREDGILGESAYAFHLDHAFMEEPIEVLSLNAVEAPPGCGVTRFADMVRAAETLPAGLRTRVAGQLGHNIIDPSSEPSDIRMHTQSHPDLPRAAHPVLTPHHRTGADTLFVMEQQTERIGDLPRDESDALLRALFDHLYQEAHLYVHAWQPGDLIVWDNRALQHARSALTELPRTLRRVSVGGSSVFSLFENADGPMHRLG